MAVAWEPRTRRAGGMCWLGFDELVVFLLLPPGVTHYFHQRLKEKRFKPPMGYYMCADCDRYRFATRFAWGLHRSTVTTRWAHCFHRRVHRAGSARSVATTTACRATSSSTRRATALSTPGFQFRSSLCTARTATDGRHCTSATSVPCRFAGTVSRSSTLKGRGGNTTTSLTCRRSYGINNWRSYNARSSPSAQHADAVDTCCT